ncbi:MAG: glycine dehydrogenase subunit 2 [Alphaproteobacteria bacterium]|jgi:glycine dehydrogenase subunit 2
MGMPMLEEKLLFEQSSKGRTGVDVENVHLTSLKTGQEARLHVGLPEVSEPQVIRHFVRLSQTNFSIDGNFYPLGSCTMKHNPRLNEKVARFGGFAAIHPLQNERTVQGALAVMHELEHWLNILTGLPATTLTPSAGAHGELTGAMIIRKAHEAKGNARKIILIPDSAHGTNPATAAMCGYTCKTIPSTKDGFVDMAAFDNYLAEHGADVAAFMLTNPSTCGLFEPNMKTIADKLHNIGAYFYCDGANFNAIMGKVRPADVGVDVMQFNLHKTFSTPHGGGGPGSGPVAVCTALIPYLPHPRIEKNDGQYSINESAPNSIGRIRAFHGQFGMFVRALTYMKSHGSEGLRQASQDAVLSANYILSQLRDDFNAPFNKDKNAYCMHECLLNDKWQKEQGVTTHDIAKALIDEGIHPMTVYFPLVVGGAMLIEPTESETKETLDRFIKIMKTMAHKIKAGSKEAMEAEFHAKPKKVFRRRLDEVTAARKHILSYGDK